MNEKYKDHEGAQNLKRVVMSNDESDMFTPRDKVITAIQIALDDELYDCPMLVPTLRDRLVAKVEALKARDTEWRDACAAAVNSGVGHMTNIDMAVIANEELRRLRAMAAKWYDHERKAAWNFIQEARERVATVCVSHQRDNYGACVKCGDTQPNLFSGPPGPASGDLEIKVDTRTEMQLYGIEAKDGPLLKGVMVDSSPEPLTFEMMQNALKRACIGGRFNPSQTVSPPLPLSLCESGPGLRAQGGEYTEPGETKVLVDHGWDD